MIKMESAESSDDTKASKKCAVCGDKALGYNFNAITCESCKAFFRRNALKNKEFNCPFSNKCEITVITRRFCQKCRLQKCLNIGMKKESILSEEEKMQKWQKIKENRAKKSNYRRDRTSNESRPETPTSPQSQASNNNSNGATSTSDRQQQLQQQQLENDDENGVSRCKIMKIDDDQLTNSLDSYDMDLKPQVTPHSQQGIPNVGGIYNNGSTSMSAPPYTTSASTSGAYSNMITTGNVFSNSGFNDVLPSMTTNFYATRLSASQQQQQQQQQQHPGPQNMATKVPPPPYNVAAAIDAFAAQKSTAANDVIKCGVQQTPYLTPQQHQQQHSEALEFMPCQSSCANSKSMTSCYGDNLDDVVAIAIKAEFHTTSLESGQGRELNEREKARIEELFIASRSLVEPVELEQELCSSEPNNLISVINMTDIAIKRIIRMAKKINPFISMCQEDQIALLKGGCTELMILRSLINYDPDKNSWRLPSKGRPRELRMDVLKEASQLGVNLYEEHQRFVQSFHPKWRSDENVMLLLSAIALFTPERSNVLHKDVVKLEQDTYYYLLKRYLETVCSGCESRSVYLNLIGKLEDLHRLNESHIQLFLEVNPKLVEPLLIEIFDLNPGYR